MIDTSSLPYYIKRGEYYNAAEDKVLRILYNASNNTPETVAGITLQPDEMRFDIFDRANYRKQMGGIGK